MLHFVTAMISASVVPLAGLIIVITSVFLLARAALDLVACFLAGPAFFAGLAFLAGVRFVFGCGTSGAPLFLSESIDERHRVDAFHCCIEALSQLI